MKLRKAISLFMVCLILASVLAIGGVAAQPTEKVSVIVGFKGRPDAALMRAHGGEIKYVYHIIPAIACSLPREAIDALEKNPKIAYIEADGVVKAIGEVLPWGVDRIDAELVHPYNKGTGIRVSIIDTGIDYYHWDLDANVAGGASFVDYTTDYMDDNGHGTHCAGIVAAEDNEIGVIGVAPEAYLYAVKVLDSGGSGYLCDVVAGLEWSVNNGMQVISMSLGTGTDYESLQAACDAAYYDYGIVVIAAAGNSGNPPGRGDNVIYPARYSSVIAVVATDKNDERARWSSTGPDVELAAPGVDIKSTLLGGGYGEKSGTSMACPHVSGAAALVIVSNSSLTNADVRQRLRDTADDLGDPGWDDKYGYGLVDADEAAPKPPDTTPPAKVTGLNVTAVSESQLDLSWNANIEPDLDHYSIYRSTTSGFTPSTDNLIASPTTYSYSDLKLTASTTYYYRVTAVDASENEGEPSDEASGTTLADTTGPTTSDVTTSPNPTNGATSVTLTATIDDSASGNSSIVAAEYFVNTVDGDGEGTSMSASDGAFDSPIEDVTATIDVSGWAVDNYTLYVRGKDVAGNWGPVSSVVLEVTEKPSTTMHVASIDMSYKKAGPNYFIYTTVKIVDANDVAVSGATVYVDVTLPDGTVASLSGDTDASGVVTLTLKSRQTGTYVATVTNVVKEGWTYTPSANIETSDSITV